jgi:cold shock CspA family protein
MSAIFGTHIAGTVASFDDPRGIGVVRTEQGDEHFFHCSAIADGTRTIEVGAPVVFSVAAGRAGQWEAFDIVAATPAKTPA